MATVSVEPCGEYIYWKIRVKHSWKRVSQNSRYKKLAKKVGVYKTQARMWPIWWKAWCKVISTWFTEMLITFCLKKQLWCSSFIAIIYPSPYSFRHECLLALITDWKAASNKFWQIYFDLILTHPLNAIDTVLQPSLRNKKTVFRPDEKDFKETNVSMLYFIFS